MHLFKILVQTALTVGLFWTILKKTPTSALLSLTILYYQDNLCGPDRISFKLISIIKTIINHQQQIIINQLIRQLLPPLDLRQLILLLMKSFQIRKFLIQPLQLQRINTRLTLDTKLCLNRLKQ